MALYKPTAADLGVIIRIARKLANTHIVEMQPGIKFNVDGGMPRSANELLVSNREDLSDTDLDDHMRWPTFRDKGVELTHEGAAHIDVYVYEWDYKARQPGDLAGNLQLIVVRGELVRIEQDGRVAWTKS